MTITGSQPAYRDALFGIARFGASRFGAYDQRAIVSIGGIVFGGAREDAFDPGILRGSLTIQDLLDDRPNTASFSAWHFQPALGAEVIITLGSTNNRTRIFAGYVIAVNQVYLSKPVNRVFHVSCIDYTWRLMQTKAFGFYQNVSATAIVLDLLARFAPTVAPTYVQAGLPTVSELTVTNEELPATFKRIADRIGAYFSVDYQGALHFFTAETVPNPAPIVPTHPSLSAVEHETDLSQLITRVLSEGGGGNTLAPIAVGATLIPVDVASWYAPAGGTVTIGPNRVRYTGVAGTSGAGSLVGPGIAPVVAPTVAAVNGGTLPLGAYGYAFTFQTAAGETKPSPIATKSSAGAVQFRPPATAPGVRLSAYAGQLTPGASYRYAYSYSYTANTAQQSTISPPSAAITADANGAIDVLPDYEGLIQSGVGMNSAFFYRSVNGGPWKYFQTMQVNFQSPLYDLYASDAAIAGNASPPADNSAAVKPGVQQFTVSNIAVGPAATTARKIYRTAANGAQLKLLTTIANNTSTGPLTDTAADGTLGANAPTADTSGLQGTAGQVAPGETAIIVAGSGWADPAGGFAIIGNGKQVVRYTGVTGTAITGIPATGPGAILAAVPYNSSITAAPILTGVPAAGDGAILWAMPAGERVNVLAILDNADAQAALRARMPGHSGIVEEYITDGRFSLAEATARGSALLNAKFAPLVTVRYTSRDVTTRSGATITAELPPPTDIHETLKIQQVTIDGFNLSPTTGLPPTYHVTASSERYSLEDLLRQVKG